MSRDHRKLRVFTLADELAVLLYRDTQALPAEERYGLRAQLRRAAISAPTNIVEGCARHSTRDYMHFLTIALGFASEVRYLLNLTQRLVADTERLKRLEDRYDELVRGIQKLVDALGSSGEKL